MTLLMQSYTDFQGGERSVKFWYDANTGEIAGWAHGAENSTWSIWMGTPINSKVLFGASGLTKEEAANTVKSLAFRSQKEMEDYWRIRQSLKGDAILLEE